MLKPSQQTVNVISFSLDDSVQNLVTEMHKLSHFDDAIDDLSWASTGRHHFN